MQLVCGLTSNNAHPLGALHSVLVSVTEEQTLLRFGSKPFSKSHQCQVHGEDTEMATVISTQGPFGAGVWGGYGVAGHYGKFN